MLSARNPPAECRCRSVAALRPGRNAEMLQSDALQLNAGIVVISTLAQGLAGQLKTAQDELRARQEERVKEAEQQVQQQDLSGRSAESLLAHQAQTITEQFAHAARCARQLRPCSTGRHTVAS